MKTKSLLRYCVILCIFSAACSMVPKRISKLSVGMQKATALDIMGPPDSVAAQGSTEYYNYQSDFNGNSIRLSQTDYFVRFIDGKVDAYGKKGDFDSTKDTTNTMNINVNK